MLMNLFVLVLFLCSFLAICEGSNNDIEIERFTIHVEESIKDIEIDSSVGNSSIELEISANNLIFECLGNKTTLNQFLIEQLSKNEINEKVLMPILKAFEEWLKSRDDPAVSFAVYVRLYDPSKTIGEQGTKSEAFRAKCFIKLAELAGKYKLKGLLKALVDPLNAPHVPEMCSYILKASYMKIHTKNI